MTKIEKLTPWSRVLLEKLIAAPLVKNFNFCLRLITVFIRAHTGLHAEP